MARGVVDKDLGYLRILRELDKLNGTVVEVGLQNDGSASDDGTLVSHYAAVNEFGTRDGRIPERSFMRSTFDETVDKLVRTRGRIIDGVYQGKLTADQGAGLLGELHQADIQKKISSHPPPPNAPSTAKRKGSTGTLVDSGVMRQSIRWVAHNRGSSGVLGTLFRRVFRGTV